MTDRYGVRSTSGKVIGSVEKVGSSSSGGSSEWDNDGFGALLIINPFAAALAGIVGWLLGTLAAQLLKTVAAAAAKALGASPITVARILTADPWAIGGPIGWLTFYALLLYLTVKWFRRPDNREVFVGTTIAIAVIIALIGGWQYLSMYASK
ncbi:MAG: hypothetical protein ABL869_03760 [Candidatus Nitrotoga sp.]